MNRRIRLLLGSSIAGLLVVAAVAGLVVSGTVFAQTPPAGQTKPAAPAQTFIAKLAAQLGITEDKLKGAIKDTETQMIDEAVQQGKLNQDQADKMKQRVQNNPNGFGLFGLHAPRVPAKPGPAALGRIGVKQVVSETAKILNMSTTEIETQLRNGQSLADIAKTKNVDRQVLIDKLVAQLAAAFDQRTKNSKLTADQIKKIKDQLPKLVGKMVDMKHPAGVKGPQAWPNGPKPGQGQGHRFAPGNRFGRGAA